MSLDSAMHSHAAAWRAMMSTKPHAPSPRGRKIAGQIHRKLRKQRHERCIGQSLCLKRGNKLNNVLTREAGCIKKSGNVGTITASNTRCALREAINSSTC